MRSMVWSLAWLIFFPRIDDSHFDRIHSSFTTVHCFNNSYLGRQPVAWKEYSRDYKWWKRTAEKLGQVHWPLQCNWLKVENDINPFPNKPWFLRVCSPSLLKTLGGKGEMLVTSNFSFFPQCFLPIWRTFCHFHQIHKLSSANSFNLEASKICCLGKG